MIKRPPNLVITSKEKLAKILIFGQEDLLARQLRAALERNGCQVNFRQKMALPAEKVNYLFQLGKFAATKKLLEKAADDNARFLLIEEAGADEGREEAEEEILVFRNRVDGRILRIGQATFSSTADIVDQILKAMFGRKQSLPALIKNKAKKKVEEKVKEKTEPVPIFRQFNLVPFLFAALAIFLLSFIPYLIFGFNFFSGAGKLQVFKGAFVSGDLSVARQAAVSAQESFSRAKKFGTLLPFLKKGERLAFFGETLAGISLAAINTSQAGETVARLSLKEEEGIISERFDQLQVELASLERQLSLTQALFKDLGLEKWQDTEIFALGEKIQRIPTLLSTASEVTSTIKKALPLARELLEAEEGGLYLVLFLNNMELRPGGGFIGSYGLARFQKGVLAEFKTFDVYTADGQLKGHVEPPVPIREHLGQPHFFLRDSNFSPDFAVNAQQAAWFLKKELDLDVDGVIAVDLTFTGKLLDSLGGVYLPDYKQKITSENLFLKAQTLIQKDFFPGSTQKRDFLGTLARQILNEIKIGQSPPWLKIGQALKETLEEKHLQIFLFDQEGQRLVEEMGAGGRISNIKYQISNIKNINIFPDYLMMVEANLGVNKANYFLKRQISLGTELNEGKLAHKLSVFYQNESPGQTFPGGVYKNYLRVFVPQKAVLKRVQVKGKEIPFEKIITEEQEGKTSWGLLVEIDPQKEGKAEFEYDLDLEKSSLGESFSYELFFQKQAGTEKDPLFLSFVYPEGWQVKKTNFSAAAKKGSLSFTSDLAVDRIFSIEFLSRGFDF